MSYESLQEIANTFLKNGHFDRAEDVYTFVTILSPSNVAGWLGLGIARYCLENVPGAKQALDIAVKLDSNRITALLWKIECFIKEGHLNEATNLFLQISKTHFDTISELDLHHMHQIHKILTTNDYSCMPQNQRESCSR